MSSRKWNSQIAYKGDEEEDQQGQHFLEIVSSLPQRNRVIIRLLIRRGSDHHLINKVPVYPIKLINEYIYTHPVNKLNFFPRVEHICFSPFNQLRCCSTYHQFPSTIGPVILYLLYVLI